MKELIETYHKMKADMVLRIAHEFKEAFKKFFADNPETHGFKWQQYTDYFNDGESCHFHRHDIGVMRTVNDEELDPWELVEKDYSENENQFVNELENVPKEIYEEMFGDHVEITATRDGFEVTEYEQHD